MIDDDIQPIFVLMDAPQWAQGEIGCGLGGTNGLHTPPGDKYLNAWASFVTQVVNTFSSVDRRPAAIEIWNEANAASFWTDFGGPNPVKYAKVFRRAADAIHAANDALGISIPVLTAGLIHKIDDTRPNSERWEIDDFLNQAYDNGIALSMRAIDGLGVHAYPDSWCMHTPPYPNTQPAFCAVWRVNEAIDEARNTRNARDPLGSAREIWVTETGAGDGAPIVNPPVPALGEARQCELEAEILTAIDARATADNIPALVIHTFMDRPSNIANAYEQRAGVVKLSPLFQPKKAYNAIKVNRGTATGASCPP